MKLDLKALAGQVKVPTINVTITLADKEPQKVDLPMLTVGDMEDLNAKSHIDLWGMMLDIYRQMQEAEKELTDEAKAAKRSAVGFEVYSKLGHTLQIEMFAAAFRHIDSTLTRGDVDLLISYGIQDQGEYIRALMFLFQGVTPEEAEAQMKKRRADDPLAEKAGPTSSEPSPAASASPAKE